MTADLGTLFREHGSDKYSNGYAGLYESLFKNLRTQENLVPTGTFAELVLLEIGVGCTLVMGPGYRPGASLRAWANYFPQARLYGIDIAVEAVNLSFYEGRAVTYPCNSTNPAHVERFIGRLPGDGPRFDVIIDDGSHYQEDQIATLRNFYPLLKPGGYYIIEGIGGDGRNLGYEACGSFHPPRPVISEIVGGDPNFIVCDWRNRHPSAILVVSKPKLGDDTRP